MPGKEEEQLSSNKDKDNLNSSHMTRVHSSKIDKRKRPEVSSSRDHPHETLPNSMSTTLESSNEDDDMKSPSRKKTITAALASASVEIERKRKYEDDIGEAVNGGEKSQPSTTTKRAFEDVASAPVDDSSNKEAQTKKTGFGSGLTKSTGFGDLASASAKSSFSDILSKTSPTTATTSEHMCTSSSKFITDTSSTSPARVKLERLEVSSHFSPSGSNNASSLFPADSTSNTVSSVLSKTTTTISSDSAKHESSIDSDNNTIIDSKEAEDTSRPLKNSSSSRKTDIELAKADEETEEILPPPKIGFSTCLLAGRATEKESASIFASNTKPSSLAATSASVFGGNSKLRGFGSVSNSSNTLSFTSMLQSSPAKLSSSVAGREFGGEEEEGGEDEVHAETEETPVEIDPNAPAANLTPIQVETGEEDEITVFSAKGKLYNFDKAKKDWNERGAGTLHLNQSKYDDEEARLVMRGEKTLRLMLNIRVVRGCACKRPGDTFVEFAGVEGADCKSVTRFLIKMTKENASTFEIVLNEKAKE